VTEIVAVDVGGTHARFALAAVENGRVARLGGATTLKTSEYQSLDAAWAEFGRGLAAPLPRAAAIALAAPVTGEVLKLTNNDWVIRPARLPSALQVDRFTLVNDFGAVAHAVALLEPRHFTHLCGPEVDLPAEGVITVVGPGTGLGVAHLLRRRGAAHVIETEGGHIDFAPLDDTDDRILHHLRATFGRVSVERIVSGSGLANIYAALHNQPPPQDEKALWQAAMAGENPLAAAALDRFCLTLGAVAGDLALAHGAHAVVIAGGLGQRLAEHLPRSGFPARFTTKGRYAARMAAMPVKIIAYPQPGLFGAAAAFAAEHSG
jgi:glucokinase